MFKNVPKPKMFFDKFSKSWREYSVGQGLILLSYLVGGFAFAWVFAPSSTQDNGTLLPRKLNSKQPTVTEAWDLAKYSHFTVFMKTGAEGKTAHVAVYGIHKDQTHSSMARLKTPSDSWLRWQQAGSFSGLYLGLEDTTDSPDVEVFIYLSR